MQVGDIVQFKKDIVGSASASFAAWEKTNGGAGLIVDTKLDAIAGDHDAAVMWFTTGAIQWELVCLLEVIQQANTEEEM